MGTFSPFPGCPELQMAISPFLISMSLFRIFLSFDVQIIKALHVLSSLLPVYLQQCATNPTL